MEIPPSIVYVAARMPNALWCHTCCSAACCRAHCWPSAAAIRRRAPRRRTWLLTASNRGHRRPTIVPSPRRARGAALPTAAPPTPIAAPRWWRASARRRTAHRRTAYACPRFAESTAIAAQAATARHPTRWTTAPARAEYRFAIWWASTVTRLKTCATTTPNAAPLLWMKAAFGRQEEMGSRRSGFAPPAIASDAAELLLNAVAG